MMTSLSQPIGSLSVSNSWEQNLQDLKKPENNFSYFKFFQILFKISDYQLKSKLLKLKTLKRLFNIFISSPGGWLWRACDIIEFLLSSSAFISDKKIFDSNDKK